MIGMESAVESVRDFNRFYTGFIGLLGKRFLDSPYSLTEARVLYEIAHRDGIAAKAIVGAMDIDAGHLSRILDSLIAAGLVEKSPSSTDGRSKTLALTRKGKAAFAKLDAAQGAAVAVYVERLSGRQRAELVRHMEGIRILLEGAGR
jgi:DNA-binding MarR family transcriptional regulator